MEPRNPVDPPDPQHTPDPLQPSAPAEPDAESSGGYELASEPDLPPPPPRPSLASRVPPATAASHDNATSSTETASSATTPIDATPPDAVQPDPDQRTWAMICQLCGLAGYLPILPVIGLVIGPLIIWAIKKKQMPFVDYHGKEAPNFNITVLIVMVILIGLAFVPWMGCLTIPLLIGVVVIHMLFTVLAALAAYEGQYYKYPVKIVFVS